MNLQMRVLVTGAQGWLGRFTVPELLRQRADLVVRGIGRSEAHDCFSYRLPDGRPAPLPPGLSFKSALYSYQSCDLRDAGKLRAVLAEFQPTHVLHLAGAVSGSSSAALQANNPEATRGLFDAIMRLGLEARIMLASSGSVYGEPVYLPQDEQHATVPVLEYAKSKLETERVAVALAQQGSLPLTIARIFNVVGPGSPASLLPGSLALQLAAIAHGIVAPRVRVGPLEAVRDYVDVRDCARAMAILAFAPAVPVVNVSSGVGTPVREIFESLRGIAKTHGVSSFDVEAVGSLPRNASVHVGSNDRLKELGYHPMMPLQQSLTDLFRWAFGVYAKP